MQPMITAARFNQFAEYIGLTKLPGFIPGIDGELVETVIHRWESLAIHLEMAKRVEESFLSPGD